MQRRFFIFSDFMQQHLHPDPLFGMFQKTGAGPVPFFQLLHIIHRMVQRGIQIVRTGLGQRIVHPAKNLLHIQFFPGNFVYDKLRHSPGCVSCFVFRPVPGCASYFVSRIVPCPGFLPASCRVCTFGCYTVTRICLLLQILFCFVFPGQFAAACQKSVAQGFLFPSVFPQPFQKQHPQHTGNQERNQPIAHKTNTCPGSVISMILPA